LCIRSGERATERQLSVGYAVAEKAESGKLFDAANLRGDKNGGLARRIRHGHFDGGIFGILFAAAKTEAAFGNIVALDDFFVEVVHADAGCEIDAGAYVAPAIRFSAARKCRRHRWF